MADIYELHKSAFAQVSAFVIIDEKGTRVATIAFKYPRDGAGRLWAYIHLIGTPMIRGYAGGYGYDKASAACENTMKSAPHNYANENAYALGFYAALRDIGGSDWRRKLEDAGFKVLQAV